MSEIDEFEKIHAVLSEGRLDDALRQLYDPQEDAIRFPFDSDGNHAWYIVGDIHYKKGDYDCAIIAYERALKEWPQDYQAHWALGDVHSQLDDHPVAERHFRKGLEMNPDCEELIYNLANSLFDQERYEDALPLYEQIVHCDPSVVARAKINLKLVKLKLKK